MGLTATPCQLCGDTRSHIPKTTSKKHGTFCENMPACSRRRVKKVTA